MKSFLSIILTVIPIGLFAANDPFYGREIVYTSPSGKQAAAALAGKLEKITGQVFTTTQGSGEEVATRDVIQLWTAETASAVPALQASLEKLEKRNVEAFVIQAATDKPGLRIIANDAIGIRHATYRYLENLGFRSLFPGPNWQIIPKKEEIRVNLDMADSPYFLQRAYFGTGGFSSKLPLDPDAKIAAMWNDWRDANLFGEALRLPGHYGEMFIQKHHATLEANPDYRAMVNGQRVPMSKQFQINYGNPEVRRLYIDDRVEAMGKLVEKFPNRTHTISVDPADGYGHCESPEAQALGSISDRVFGLANDVAKEVGEKFPGNYVNLYAYNMHAGVPKFPLESNIIVSLVPYGFNMSEGQVGDALIIAWKEFASQIGVYDYWGIPDWSRGMPGEDYVKDLPRRMKVWVDNNVRFFNAETTTGAGAAGIPLYLASKYFWNPKTTDYQKELDTFYDTAFGPARPVMQRMLERWAGGFQLHYSELGSTYRDLNEALSLAKGHPDVTARIEDFITYAHYLRLLWEYDITPRQSEERIEAAHHFTRFLWQIRENGMVQTFRIAELMKTQWMRGIKAYVSDWQYDNPDAPGWATVPAYPSSAEIATLLKDGTEKYPFLMDVRRFSNDLVPLSTTFEKPEAELTSTHLVSKRNRFVFQALEDGDLELGVYFRERPKMEAKGIISIDNQQTNEVFLRDLKPLDGNLHMISFKASKGTTYRLRVDDRGAQSYVSMPSNLPFVAANGFLQGKPGGVYYFYVPKGTRHFGFYVQNNPVPQKTHLSVNGNIVPPLRSEGGLMVYEVRPDEDDKVWMIEGFASTRPVSLINVPNNFAYSPKNLMVPREVLPQK